MNVSLTPELEGLINSKVATGMYGSASEVVREGLRLLQERDETREEKLAWLRNAIRVGMEDAEAGRLVDGPTAMETRRKRLLEMKKNG